MQIMQYPFHQCAYAMQSEFTMSWKKFKSLYTQSQKLLLRLILTQKKSQAHAELWVNK